MSLLITYSLQRHDAYYQYDLRVCDYWKNSNLLSYVSLRTRAVNAEPPGDCCNYNVANDNNWNYSKSWHGNRADRRAALHRVLWVRWRRVLLMRRAIHQQAKASALSALFSQARFACARISQSAAICMAMWHTKMQTAPPAPHTITAVIDVL